jgi:hypothetical protein
MRRAPTRYAGTAAQEERILCVTVLCALADVSPRVSATTSEVLPRPTP